MADAVPGTGATVERVSFKYWYAVWAFIACQAALALYFGLPGHLSVDSLVQLYEAHTGQSISFNPPFMSALLAWFGKLGNPPIIFVCFIQLLYSLCIWLLFRQRQGTNRLLLALALLSLGNPLIAVYTGIVWKDVLMAHVAGCLFIYLITLHRLQLSLNPLRVFACLVLMTLTLGSRQQGLLFFLPAAVALACILPLRTWLKPLALVAIVITTFLLTGLVKEQIKPRQDQSGTAIGLRVMAHYDLAGTLANGGELAGDYNEIMQRELAKSTELYSPYRVDTLRSPASQIWNLPAGQLAGIWFATILANPGSYAAHRWDHYYRLLGFDDRSLCQPLYTGVAKIKHPYVKEGELSELLGYAGKANPHARQVRATVLVALDSPLFAHWFYGVVMLLATLFLLRSGEYIAATYGLTSLAFMGSFLLVSIACDFRYMYTSMVAATLLTAYSLLVYGSKAENMAGE